MRDYAERDSVPQPIAAEPAAVLETRDAIGIVTGIVIGAGIFTVPALVAQNAREPWQIIALWLGGGVLSVIGALCYAELATSYRNAGGDYYFVRRAYGAELAFVYAWSRVAVITTGSIAYLALTFGDYVTRLWPLGAASSSVYATLAIVILTAINLAGIREAKTAQNLLTAFEVAGVLAVIAAGFYLPQVAANAAGSVTSASDSRPSYGTAMILVLFAYGGWNEAAYVSAEVKTRRGIVRALLLSLALVTALYAIFNVACLRALGRAALAGSTAVAADLMGRAWGKPGVVLMTAIIAVSTLSSMNATMIAGARSNFALGRDTPRFSWLARWNRATGTPFAGVVLQALVALALVVLGQVSRQGLQLMIDFTAPVFWWFFLLVGVSLLVLRAREPARERPFRVPLYPATPLVFVATCAYLFYASLRYAKTGAIAGVGVMLMGVSVIALARQRRALAALSALASAALIAFAFPEVRRLLAP